MRNYLLFCITIYCTSSYGQQSIPYDCVLDVYGFTLKLEEVILEEKCDCCVAGEWKGTCVLLRGTIDSVFLLRDTTVYSSAKQLSEVQYFSISWENYQQLSRDGASRVYIFAENTCSPQILKVNTAAGYPSKLPEMGNCLAFSIGLMNCVKATFWQKVKLRFSGNVENMKLKSVSPDESIFFRKVQSLELSSNN